MSVRSRAKRFVRQRRKRGGGPLARERLNLTAYQLEQQARRRIREERKKRREK